MFCKYIDGGRVDDDDHWEMKVLITLDGVINVMLILKVLTGCKALWV